MRLKMEKFLKIPTLTKIQDDEQKIKRIFVIPLHWELHRTEVRKMFEKNISARYIYDFLVHKTNGIVDESTKDLTGEDLKDILSFFIEFLEGFITLVLCGNEVITSVKNAKNDAQFENIIGIFRAKYRGQTKIEESVLTASFEKHDIAMLGVA